jgi:hypothetical protein
MYDSPQALAESLLAMSPARMERALARLFAAGGTQSEALARLHLLQMKRHLLEASRSP